MSELTKLKLSACNADKKVVGPSFSVMINPETISMKQTLKYTNNRGVNSKLKKFTGFGDENITIPAILLDTTGVIPEKYWPNHRDSIIDMIDDLKKVVYEYVGDEHQPYIVQVQWGSFLCYTRLNSLDIKYTLFNRAGEPIRALVTLHLSVYETESEVMAKKNQHSPDMTHLVEVQAGDSLPLMCERVYKDPSMYLQVAKVNHLANFRKIKPGMRLVFPPIVNYE